MLVLHFFLADSEVRSFHPTFFVFSIRFYGASPEAELADKSYFIRTATFTVSVPFFLLANFPELEMNVFLRPVRRKNPSRLLAS